MEIKRFGNIEGKTMMLLHGNLMCWWQFEDLIPLLERKFCVYAVSFDGFDGTGKTTYTTAQTDFEGHAAKAISNGTRKVHACMGAALYGADGTGNADYAPPYPGSYQLGIRPGHLGGRTLSLSNGLFGTTRCKGRLLVRRKRRAHEKGHPAAADGISEPDRPLFPRFRPWRDHQSSGTACVGDGALSGRRRDSGRCAAESGK